MNKLLITRWDGGILTALWDGSRVVEFRMEREAPAVQVGDIYLGKIKNIVKNIRAAFVEVRPGILCFLQLPKGEQRYREGDEIPVQVSREAVKTKSPVVTDRISLGGRYLVLVSDQIRVAVSSKIRDSERREALQKLLTEDVRREQVGFILRTNAERVEDCVICEEAARLISRYRQITETSLHRPAFTRLWQGAPAYLEAVRDAREGSLESVITDDAEIYENLQSGLADADYMRPEQIVYYQDTRLSLKNLYRLEHFMEQALNRRVWLKSGGYLIIEPTEALTVIDVNTGKYDGHRGAEETFFRINQEAAREIAFQMRLRNLSGIILVDFIDMEDPEHRQGLYQTLREAIRQDPVKTILVDITALNLAELTRKKTRKTLQEQMKRKDM
ncbi:MAG: ribonuclease E/G [Lachnospiraceae bacterium]|nr:ribonuclease E/G [Lachnospiraceae bacterium]